MLNQKNELKSGNQNDIIQKTALDKSAVFLWNKSQLF